jgi:hypothetical protein
MNDCMIGGSNSLCGVRFVAEEGVRLDPLKESFSLLSFYMLLLLLILASGDSDQRHPWC